jgi:ABC-type sulfate/molybdate transport systems ATPase subunit
MALLSLDGVWKQFSGGRRGAHARMPLSDVSLDVDQGELVSIFGRRRSGKTTLLRIVAGIEAPTRGVVRFDGTPVSGRTMLGAPGGIGYCTGGYADLIGRTVVEHVAAAAQDAGGSLERAHNALRRVDAAACAELEPHELDPQEAIRVAIARALVMAPRLLLLDEPVIELRARGRDEFLEWVRDLAHDDGIAVVMMVGEAMELAGSDRALSLDAGVLRGELRPSSAEVVPLRRAGTDCSA